MAERIKSDPTAPSVLSEDHEDRRQPGWPQLSRVPYVEPSYYLNFDEKVRPVFNAGGGTALSMTAHEAEAMGRAWTQTWKLVTVFNFRGKPWTTPIPGSRPGSHAMVTVPPYGMLRSVREALPLGQGQEGSVFAQIYEIPPEGECGGRMIKDPSNPAVQISGCNFLGCSRHPSFGWVHSIQHAYHVLQSIGEAFPASDRVGGPSAYTPAFKETTKALMDYQELDPREPVSSAVGRRLMMLNQQESKITEAQSRGIAVGGR